MKWKNITHWILWVLVANSIRFSTIHLSWCFFGNTQAGWGKNTNSSLWNGKLQQVSFDCISKRSFYYVKHKSHFNWRKSRKRFRSTVVYKGHLVPKQGLKHTEEILRTSNERDYLWRWKRHLWWSRRFSCSMWSWVGVYMTILTVPLEWA